jgi:hypothetical protein
MFWGIVQAIGDGLIAMFYSQAAFVIAWHATIGLALCFVLSWLIHMHLSPGMRVKFDVNTKTEVATGIGILGGLTLGLCFIAWVWSAQTI